MLSKISRVLRKLLILDLRSELSAGSMHLFHKNIARQSIIVRLQSYGHLKPQPKKSSDENILNLIKESEGEKCDFCAKRVASDPLGILENDRVYVAANSFKLQDYHALFIPKKHNPLNMTFGTVS